MTAPAQWEFQSIPIDFEVFKALTGLLESPTDSYNGVLRRLLKLPKTAPASTVPPNGQGRAWVVDGVTFPEGTEFRARYKKREYFAKVQDGALMLDGRRYFKPSPAAIAVTHNAVNGWRFWECRKPGQNVWTRIDRLRSR